jgi:hypothetical protein
MNSLIRIFILIFVIVLTGNLHAQKNSAYPARTLKVDTVLFTNDSSDLFVQELWDTTTVQSYHCSIDSADRTFRYGFFYLKKGLYREYFVKNIRDRKSFPRPKKYEGFRGQEIRPGCILRLK